MNSPDKSLSGMYVMYHMNQGNPVSIEVGRIINMNSSQRTVDIPFEGSVHTATLAVCTVLVIFVLLLGCLGNGMVLLAAIRSKKLRTNFDVVIFNLAGADFIMSMFLSPIFLFLLFSDPPTPQIFCGSTLFLGTVCGLLSLLSIFSIAVHRLARVTGHIKGALKTSHTGAVLAFIWIVSFAISSGGTLYISLHWNSSFQNCQKVINGQDRQTHNFILFFLAPVCLLCFITITLSYSTIAYTVQNQVVLRRSTPIYRQCTESSEKPGELMRDRGRQPICKHGSSCNGPSQLDKENKALTMCFVVVLTTLLCWGPLIVSQFVELISGESITLYQVKLCGIALVFLNSALNPFIYSHHSGKLRKKYSKLLRKAIKCDFSGKARVLKLRINNLESNRYKSSNWEQDTHTIQIGAPKQTNNKCASNLLTQNNRKRDLRTYTRNVLLGSEYTLKNEMGRNKIYIQKNNMKSCDSATPTAQKSNANPAVPKNKYIRVPTDTR